MLNLKLEINNTDKPKWTKGHGSQYNLSFNGVEANVREYTASGVRYWETWVSNDLGGSARYMSRTEAKIAVEMFIICGADYTSDEYLTGMFSYDNGGV